DSSHRFERGVSPDLQVKALERATKLITTICGGKVGPITDVIANDDLLTKAPIAFKRSQIKRHLGIEVDDARVVDILERLACEVDAADDDDDDNNAGWKVTPPIFRFDLSTPEDLVEEIARIYGYDNIPAKLRPMKPLIAIKPEGQVREESLQNVLVERGYQEAITYSFVPSEIEGLLAPDQEQIKLSNPISEELSIMRSTLWSGLIPALDKNVKRQQSRVRLFESGLTFIKSNNANDLPEQRKKLAGVITGSLYSEQWNETSRDVDFFDLKGDVEALLAEASAQRFEFEKTDHSSLHPGQSAKILCNGKQVGVLGALHPSLEKKLSLDQQVFVFELDLDLMAEKKIPEYQGLSPYPSVRRDLALLIKQDVSYAQIDKVLKNSQIDGLVDNFVFDVYEGENLDKGQKSLALGLIFQDFSRTLEEQDISTHIEKIVSVLKEEVGAVLR
ncbi:MAG TPA: phenylalanine--tRNA ligase subunit beta, partial [Leucothrix sp.]|nr:phenylalanine--tRNA ligase subunit beta [Leucothrix sp.]